MDYIRKANERGVVNMGWLQSNHSFSFGSYYDPQHMGVSVLRVINDDVVQPGAGFGTHGHRDVEIISYVIDGALEHKDSTGNEYVVPAGEVQRMSAGRGVMHSEYNASQTEPVNFLQIWIHPNVKGIEPEYEQKRIEQDGPLTPIVTPNGDKGALRINQDASMYRLELEKGEAYRLQTPDRQGYLHLVHGSAEINGDVFNAGDAIAPQVGKALDVNATEKLEALWFDLPKG
ncbi:pirin family protein [Aestuariibacter salexigens]|uniref:pirin family protein n=1 Tax=Aestuariibacter salexigens TaxID=226010 RepID=UPI0004251769|nr:pirin family protein [Aestuariibacter salexigens]